MRKFFGLFLLLSLFWGINSGHASFMLIGLGLFSIAIVMFLSYRMDMPDRESFPTHLFTRIWPFYFWLMKEIVIGNLYVLRTILFAKGKVEPGFIKIKLNFNEPMSEVIFANSITLVPGTLSVEVEGDTICVHTLNQELADELSTGDLAARIKRLED